MPASYDSIEVLDADVCRSDGSCVTGGLVAAGPVPPPLAAGVPRPAGDGADARVWDILHFFEHSRRSDAAGAHAGTLSWELRGADGGGEPLTFSVRLPADARATPQTWLGEPPDGCVTTRVCMTVDDFLFVYSGRASAAAIASLLLSGRARVPLRGLRDVQAFASAFDYSLPSWVAVLRARGDGDGADRLLREAWARAAPDELLDAYRDASATIGREVRVELPGSVLFGTATDVTRTGELVVVDDQRVERTLSVGDVVHLRPAK
jgi:hypothetical protein